MASFLTYDPDSKVTKLSEIDVNLKAQRKLVSENETKYHTFNFWAFISSLLISLCAGINAWLITVDQEIIYLLPGTILILILGLIVGYLGSQREKYMEKMCRAQSEINFLEKYKELVESTITVDVTRLMSRAIGETE